MGIGIGIDTGGTYTDCVAYDFTEKKILASAKSLTTKEDLSIGIGKALDGLPSELRERAKMVSLSTTLATNACVENKGGRAKLVFLGVDRRVVADVGKNYGLPDANDIYFIDCECRLDGKIEREPDWGPFTDECQEWFSGAVAAAVVDLRAMNNGAVWEKRAKEIIAEQCGIPVVCGYELFSDLNSVRRGAGTLLNARLITVIAEFLGAIKKAVQKRGMNVPVVIVRSDGSLMSEEFTGVRPVETLLCGPAASVMGGISLTGEKNSLIVDMGGTTTDIAIVKNSVPLTAVDGINVGNWRTYVKGLYIDTFGLGGDSAVRYRYNTLFLDSERVVPLCVTADKSPSIVWQLKNLLKNKKNFSYFAHEFFVLVNDIANNPAYSEEERKFCEALKREPLIVSEAAALMGRDPYTFEMQRLEREGVIIRSGLTPTDVMHLRGDFDRYDTEASELGAKYVARCIGKSVEEVCQMVYDGVKKKMYCNIVRILMEDYYQNYGGEVVDESMQNLIENSYEMTKNGSNGSFLRFQFQTPASLVGIGAPIHIFLPDVAKALGTKCVIPEHAGVANALGAVVGNISATSVVEIKPKYSIDGLEGYTVYGKTESAYFEEYEEAIAAGKRIALAEAEEEAKQRGACGRLKVTDEITDASGRAKDSDIYLGTKIKATAVGRMSFV